MTQPEYVSVEEWRRRKIEEHFVPFIDDMHEQLAAARQMYIPDDKLFWIVPGEWFAPVPDYRHSQILGIDIATAGNIEKPILARRI